MTGYLLLEGGAEFGGGMAVPDRRALELAGGFDAPVVILPTAAAPDHNDQRAGQNGALWFAHLGARRVSVLPLVDVTSANSAEIAGAIRAARLIYLLGGFPDFLARTLAGSLSASAMAEAYQAGAVLGGSSAGAMVLCEHYYNPEAGRVVPGLNFIPKTCVIPHHNTFGRSWVPRLAALFLPGEILIGIDEQTGIIAASPQERWIVYGKGAVTLYRDGSPTRYPPGDSFLL